MFGRKFELFSILGFRVSLDSSWFLLAILITWSLATGYFPSVIEGLSTQAAWVLGVAGALGLFLSIVVHEFSHAIIARQFNLPISGITLFIFGGVAEMEDMPPNARAEFFMAIAGPIASIILAGLFYGLSGLFPAASPDKPLAALFSYLALINTVLAVFNLIPAFPLDGGRVFRAAVWWWTGDVEKATNRAAFMGRLLGSLLVAIGVLSMITGNFISGLWQGLIGLFIIGAAESSQMQMALKTELAEIRVQRVMVSDLVTVPADTLLDDLVESYFHRHFHKAFPVVQNGTLLGCIRLEDIGGVKPVDRYNKTVGDIMASDSMTRVVRSDTPILDALKVMQKHHTSRLMVVDNGVLKGMLTMRDVMSFLAVRQKLGSAKV